jgi:hypothetical protein
MKKLVILLWLLQLASLMLIGALWADDWKGRKLLREGVAINRSLQDSLRECRDVSQQQNDYIEKVLEFLKSIGREMPASR